MKFIKITTFFVISLNLICFFSSTDSYARDLSYRLGLGFVDQFSNSNGNRTVPCISLKYAFTKSMAVSGLLGMDTAEPSVMTVGGKFFKNLFFEENLNFYWGLGLASLSEKTSYLEMQTFFGSEFFIPGIESLGLSFEVGVAASGSGGKMHILTTGSSFLKSGIHFYF